MKFYAIRISTQADIDIENLHFLFLRTANHQSQLNVISKAFIIEWNRCQIQPKVFQFQYKNQFYNTDIMPVVLIILAVPDRWIAVDEITDIGFYPYAFAPDLSLLVRFNNIESEIWNMFFDFNSIRILQVKKDEK
jgi:hypothetical protein